VSGKKHKRELKRQREALKAQARQEERRRTLITMGIVGLVILVGLGLIWDTIRDERAADVAAACGARKPEAADAERPQSLPEAPSMALVPGDYTAVIKTSCGKLEVDLYEDRAPATVNNFVALAAIKFYDGLQVFRHAPSIFALQTGSATNSADFQIGYTFPDELAAAQSEGYTPGSLAMANSGPNTNGSQFFFTYDKSELPPQYSKFGNLEEGIGALKAMAKIEVDGEAPKERIYIESVEIFVDGKPLEDVIETDKPSPSASPKSSTSPSASPSATPGKE
jgi:peptidyl-prolyl cis-trans isomerase B (cyclophilin B)